ncbi:MAG: helix-turn-helix domain-containing protein [Flavisolibacter sp.]
MAGKEKIIEKVIAEIDWFIIERVRELRKEKFSQVALSIEIGFAEGFIGRVENPNQSAVYNPRHINLIAKALKVKIADLMPEGPLSNDLVRLTIMILPPTKPKKGEANYKVIKKTSLTEEEIKEYNKKTLNRPSKSGDQIALKKRKSSKNKK